MAVLLFFPFPLSFHHLLVKRRIQKIGKILHLLVERFRFSEYPVVILLILRGIPDVIEKLSAPSVFIQECDNLLRRPVLRSEKKISAF